MDQSQIENPIRRILSDRKTMRLKGIYSCCSANEYVLRAVMRRVKRCGAPALIESTANQVNQFGGYTGMRPADFAAFVARIAGEEGVPRESIFCGGDHLGPLTWASEPAEEAMRQAEHLVRDCVLAGYIKIHIDTSMRLGGDNPEQRLSDETIAARGARLCGIAEQAYSERLRENPNAVPPVYVIGSEVPVPGGATQNESEVAVTSAEDCLATISAFRLAFGSLGLQSAWERVVALVVQPGVEFADESVVEYDSASAKPLVQVIDTLDGIVFEGHSTDYQPARTLREMVRDGVAVLKVGPALTFGLREGLFALECIERELAPVYGFEPSCLRAVLDRIMIEKPAQWSRYYHGSAVRVAFKRAFSFSDRVRYYLPQPEVQAAVDRLMDNLGSVEIPLALISQYMPMQYAAVRNGEIQNRPESLLIDRIGDWIDDYLHATIGESEA